MKQYITLVLLGLGLCQAALGGPGSTIYQNQGFVTNVPVVDALAFLNTGEFDIVTGDVPFMTKDTLYFTNTSEASMLGISGFRFDTGTSTSRHSASSFFNAGTVEGIDLPGAVVLYAPYGSTTTDVPVPSESQPLASQVLVWATNIVNAAGVISVGDYGLLRLVGNNVTNAYATLKAGSVSTAGLSEENETGLQGQNLVVGANKLDYFVGSPGVYDLFWGITNTQNLEVDSFNPANTATAIGLKLTLRGGATGSFPLPITANPVWSVSVYSNSLNTTNIYYNIVLVNTNFSDANISAAVGFYPKKIHEPEAVVQFSEPVYDVVTGETVTNGVYLLDNGAALETTNSLADNASSASSYSRPNAFGVTTVTPADWLGAFPGNIPYDPTVFYPSQELQNKNVPYVVSEYGAQIGRNPAILSGSFSSPIPVAVNLPDPTNEPGRIEIGAANLDITQSRLRAEGMVILNVTNNLTGNDSAAVDWGEMNATIGAANGSLVISNVFPATFQRLRGDIYAWEATWQNDQTNSNLGDTNFPATNTIHYHVLVVDQNLAGTFPSTVRNLSLTGKNSVVLQDNLYVINQDVFNTTNLTINSSVALSQNAENFTPANTPYLKNLFLDTNGILEADDTLDVGYDVGQGQGAPAGQTYTVNTITNFGEMLSSVDLLQSAIFENDGIIFSAGSMVIEANALDLGLALTNAVGLLEAEGNVNLSATTIQAKNSIIFAGSTLNLYATGQLTDLVSGTPTTNTNSVIINHWTVNDGFTLPVKPATGDLFGTEIRTISTGSQQVVHVWAGMDMGATPAGFVNNEVIGRLVLDRQSNSASLRFSAAGAKNAMYVDYLELDDYAYSNRSGLDIDPNFTIYFADSNGDPTKLAEVPGLVWVSNFVGPNSTQVIPYTNSSVVCLMNAGVANSTEISFWDGIANYDLLNGLDGNPPDPYLLNNPDNWLDFMDCPGTYSFPCNCTPGTNGAQLLLASTNSADLDLNLLTVSYNGQGTISNVPTQSQLVLNQSYTLTAKPATGWVFDYWTKVAMGGSVATNYLPALTFTFVTNTVVTANFIPTPFPALQGAYDGLFFETNAVDPGSSGSVSLTLAASGSFSGKLVMGPSTYSFTSQFTGSGAAQFLAMNGAQSLTVNLQLDIIDQTGQILGDVNGGTWDAALAAEIVPAWTTKNPSPLAGNYTMVLPWETGTVGTPGGDSYGAGAISPLGVLTLAGALADGATFSASALVSRNNQWPFYAYVASGQDSVLGWVTVSNGLAGTNISWSKASGHGPLYPAGFTNILQLVGSPWRTPSKLFPAPTLLNPAVILSGGNLPESLTNAVTTKNFLAYTAKNMSLTIKSTSGSFSGSFNNPVTGKKQTISGVVLTNEDSARGFFLGTNESGAVLLQGQ